MPCLALVGYLLVIKSKLPNCACYAGDDDATDAQCQIQSVPNVLEGNILNHVSIL